MDTRDPSGMKAGNGPYRETRLRPEEPPAMRPAPALGSGALISALAVVRMLFAHREPPSAVRTPSPYVEHATSLGGGSAGILAVFSDRQVGRDEVLRLPGTPRRAGDDVQRAPEVLAANGAVAAVAGGAYLTDTTGALLSALGPWVSPMETWNGVDGRIVQVTPGFVARTQSGHVYWRGVMQGGPNSPGESARASPVELHAPAVDLAGDDRRACARLDDHAVWCFRSFPSGGAVSPFVPTMDRTPFAVPSLALPDGEQLVVAAHHVCARGHSGVVVCAHFDSDGRGASPVNLVGDVPRAAGVALSDDDLCVLGVDGALSCAHGPQEDTDLPLRADVIRLHRALDGVTEVALTEGLGCVRRGGSLACWGATARGGWVTTRTRPVPMVPLRDVEALRAAQGLVCALQRGDVWCWGTVQRFDGGPLGRRPRPQRVMLPQPARRFLPTRHGLCARLDDDSVRCWSDVGPDAMVYPPPGGDRLVAVPGPAQLDEARSERFAPALGPITDLVGTHPTCARGEDGRVACLAEPPAGEPDAPPSIVPIAGVRELVEAHGLICALRGDRSVSCWGSNASGALTLAESERAPRLVPVQH